MAAPTTFLYDACTLLTFSDAEAIAGIQLRRMRTYLDQEEGPDFAKCSYGDPGSLGKTISLEVRRLESAERALRVHDSSRSKVGNLASDQLSEIAGLGDSAFWADGRVEQLHAVRANLRMIVTVNFGDEAERAAAAEQVARLAFQRMDAVPPPG